MTSTLTILLREPSNHFQIAWKARRGRLNTGLFLAGVAGAMAWGAAMGAHVGGAHVLITSIKMPLFFLFTLVLCFPLMHIVLLVSGLKVHVTQTLTVTLSGLSTTTLALGACAPVVALFGTTAPIPSMASYLNLYVLCLACGVVAGVAGLRALAHGLRSMGASRVRRPLMMWAFVYQFVGAQVAWVLRPWIGASAGVDGYSLQHGLSGNFYMGVGAVLLRWLKQSGAIS